MYIYVYIYVCVCIYIYIHNLCGQKNKTQKHAGEPNLAVKVFVI